MAQLLLRPIKLTLFKDYSSGDGRQSPASGAVVTVYYEGATSSAATTIGTSATACPVYNCGAIAVGDTLQLNTDSTTTFTVTAVADTSITIASLTGSAVGLAIGDRLVVMSRVPTLYNDEAATVARADNTVTADSRGFVQFYTAPARIDYIVTGSGVTTTLVKEELAGWLRGGVAQVSVKDYSTFGAAITALSGGGELLIPAGTYTPNTTPSFVGGYQVGVANKQLSFLGEGRDVTVLSVSSDEITTSAAGYINTDLFTVVRDNVTFKDMTIKGPNQSGTGTGRLICTDRSVNSLTVIRWLLLDNVKLRQNESYALELGDTSIFVTVNRCQFDSGKYSAMKVNIGSTTLWFRDTEFATPGKSGATFGTDAYAMGSVWIEGASKVMFTGCTFEHDGNTPYLSLGGQSGGLGRWVWNLSLRDCYFERDAGGTFASSGTSAEYGINTQGHIVNLLMDNCYWTNAANTSVGPRILKTGATASGLTNATIANSSFNCAVVAGSMPTTDDISLGTSTDNGMVLNSQCSSTVAGFQPIQITPSGSRIRWTYLNSLGVNMRDTTTYTYYGGAFRLPQQSIAQMDGMTKAFAGDMIACSDYIPGVPWYYENGTGKWVPINAAPRFTTAQLAALDGVRSTIDGAVVYVTDATAGQELKVRVGGAWKYITHS